MRKGLVFIIAVMPALLFSCSKKNLAAKDTYRFKSINGKPDYSSLAYWAAHPWKWDPSDSIPRPLKNDYRKDSLADVFFLYPTSFTKLTNEKWNASIDDSIINAKTDYSSILYQASAFAERTRVFAPRYRQANLKAYFTKDTITALQAFDLAYSDIREAFIYYLQHYNNGRPIIIASHSQGTTHAMRLLKEFFEGKPLGDKLICAYLIGMPVHRNYFTSIPVCTDSLSTGCIVSWRTYKKNYTEPLFVAKETFSAVVINPLLWTAADSYAPRSLNKGGILRNYNKIKPGVVDAQIHHNVLWTSKPRFFGNLFLTLKNYHIADINFFYMNLAENVKARLRSYMSKRRG